MCTQSLGPRESSNRWSVVLLFLLLVIAARFGQDVVLGAMLAGIVLRSWTRRMGIDVHGLEEKFDAVADDTQEQGHFSRWLADRGEIRNRVQRFCLRGLGVADHVIDNIR